MSKSKGNIVTPDEAVAEYGADALRVFELFVAPFEQNVQWSNEGMQGSVRFLSRVMKWGAELSSIYQPDWALMIDQHDATDLSRQIRRATHQMVAKCGHDIERFAFNTYISAMMTALNKYGDLMPKDANSLTEAEQAAWSEALSAFIRVLAPAAPHTADEMWSGLGYEEFTLNESWPAAIEALAAEDEVTVAVQVNGKLRDTITLPAGLGNEELEQHALASEKVKAHLDGKTVRKVIVIPGKLVNVVAN
jgi:leucyl-tRNA synthetase